MNGKPSSSTKLSLVIIVAGLFLSGCGGGGGRAGNPVTPIPPPQPPPPPVCTFTFSWTNPTEDIEGRTLEPNELTAATLYQFRIPMAAPEEVDAITDAGDPYTTMWVLRDVQQGIWYFRLTVNNLSGESEHSNEVSKVC